MPKAEKSLIRDIFIDRIKELALLKSGLMHGKDYILIAPRRFGKTTLVNKVFDEIRKDKAYLLISMDIMRYSASIKTLAEGITEQCLAALGYKGKLQLLLKQVGVSLQFKMSFGDLDIESVLKLLQTKSNDVILLGHALDLLEKVAIKTGKTVIVFFDEFGELYELGDEVIKIFRSVLQTQKHVCSVFAGSQETLMSKIFVEKKSAFYRFGDIIKLGALDKHEVIQYLSTTKFDYSVAQNILDLLECHPYYTSKVIRDLLIEPEYAASSMAFYRYIQERLIPQESSYVELLIQKIKSRTHTLEILTNLALENPVNFGLEAKSRQSIFKLVKLLETNGYIVKTKIGYKLIDPLVKLYLAG